MKTSLIVLITCLLFIGKSQAQEICITQITNSFTNSNYGEVIRISESCYPDSIPDKNIAKMYAQALVRSGMQKKAKNYCEQILESSDSLFFAHLILAQIYEQEENPPKAIKHYMKCHQADTMQVQWIKKLASLFIRSGDIPSAFHYYNMAHTLQPEDITVITSLAEIFLENDQQHEADSLLQFAYGLDSSNVKVLLLSARVLYQNKDYAIAVKRLERANEFVDFSQYFNKLYGYALLRIDSLDRSIYFLEKALVGERTNREYAHYYLAIAYEKKEKPDFAIFHYERAISEGISENISTYFKNLGLVYEKQNNFPEAIKSYKKGLDWNSGKDDILLFYLARACDQYYKDKSIAVRWYSKYIESSDEDQKLKKYAIERIQYLREIAHMKQ